jgi:hypothetical protein
MSEGPNIDNSFLYRQMQQAQGQGGSGSSPLLLGARLDTNVGTPLDIKRLAPINFDGMIVTPAQRPNGPIAGLLKQMGLNGPEILEGMKKVAQAGPVREANQAELFGQGGPAGGSFVSAVTGPSAGDDGHGIG